MAPAVLRVQLECYTAEEPAHFEAGQRSVLLGGYLRDFAPFTFAAFMVNVSSGQSSGQVGRAALFGASQEVHRASLHVFAMQF